MLSELAGGVSVKFEGDETTLPAGKAASLTETKTFVTVPNPTNSLLLVYGPPL